MGKSRLSRVAFAAFVAGVVLFALFPFAYAIFSSLLTGSALYDTDSNLMKDGIGKDGNCGVTNAGTYTYLQGVLPGALTELYKADHDTTALDRAVGVANAATNNSSVVLQGVAYYPPEELNDDGLKVLGPNTPCPNTGARCASDGSAFKGAEVRNLRELYNECVAIGRSTGNWRAFLLRQQQSLIDNGRAGWSEFGMHWLGPIALHPYITFGSQLSAVDAFNAAAGL